MTRYQKIASKDLREYLANREEPISLYAVTCIMDDAVREAGKKRDLFESLWDYTPYLPEGWRVAMLSTSDSDMADSLAYAVPPGWEPGSSDSNTMVLGPGKLRYSRSRMD